MSRDVILLTFFKLDREDPAWRVSQDANRRSSDPVENPTKDLLEATHRITQRQPIRTGCRERGSTKKNCKDNGYRRTIVQGNMKRGVMENLL